MRPGLPTHPETSPIVAHAGQAFGPHPLTSLVVIPLQDFIDGGHAINARLSAEQNDFGSDICSDMFQQVFARFPRVTPVASNRRLRAALDPDRLLSTVQWFRR